MLVQIVLTVFAMSAVTALFVAICLWLLSVHERQSGELSHHSAGNQAVMAGSTLAAAVYIPLLLVFVWDVTWWCALIAVPSAIVVGMPGLVLSLPLLQLGYFVLRKVRGDEELEL